jgi:hypothetical protein
MSTSPWHIKNIAHFQDVFPDWRFGLIDVIGAVAGKGKPLSGFPDKFNTAIGDRGSTRMKTNFMR